MTPPTSHVAIHLDGLTFKWPGASAATLDLKELSVQSGERLFIQGPSGSGKTTLLNLLAGVLSPTTGTVHILGQNLGALSARQTDRFRAQHIGFVFQMFNLLPYLSLLENVTLPCRFSKPRHERAMMSQATSPEAEATRLLSLLNLDVDALNQRPVTQLSVGQQQRVAVARALIGRPELIIADEPTSALDATARAAFIEVLSREITDSGATLVFVSHDPSLQPLFDRTITLEAQP